MEFPDDNNNYGDLAEVFAPESPELEFEEDGVTIKPYEVDCLPNDYNITSLISLIDRGYLKIPSFQRNYVWKKDMASKFIESIIIGLPIPQVFLFERERNNFLVIDGQQRLVTVYLFRKQRFPKNDNARAIIRNYLSKGEHIPENELSGDNFEDFKLKLPKTTEEVNLLNNLKYDTLKVDDTSDFRGDFDFNRTIRTITIKQVIPSEDYSSMFEIFSRLNSGGVILKPQEIRISLYHSSFYDTIIDKLNKNSNWRKFLGKTELDLHMADVEVLIRAFAMLEMNDEYKAPMRNFLNEFSKKAMGFKEDDINRLSGMYEEFWQSCKDLNDDAFKNDGKKFVVSLFESVFVAVCDIIKSEGLNGRSIPPECIVSLKQNTDFINASQKNTASKFSVVTRLSAAKEIIRLR